MVGVVDHRRNRGPRAVALGAVLVATAVGGAWRPVPVQAAALVPVADTLTVVHDRLATVPAPGVLGNDVGIGAGTTAILDTPPTHGIVNLAPNGGYTYRPTAGFVGTDRFWYHPSGLIVITTPVTITITNVAPNAANDAYSAVTGVTLAVAAPGVLANDTDGDGDSLTASLVDGSGNGSLTLNANGGFTFKSGGSFSGTRTFTYRAFDGIAWSAIATVSITVRSPAPTSTPTPTSTPAPTSTPTPTALPSIGPLPTTLPTPLPTGVPTATPFPTPSGGVTPTASARPSASAAASAAASPSSSGSPAPGGTSASPSAPPSGTGTTGTGGGPASGPDGPVPSGDSEPDGRFLVGRDGLGSIAIANLHVSGLGSLTEWAIPGLALAVPGLLVLFAIIAQTIGGILWLPVTRRWLGAFGIGRRRRRWPRPA